MTHNPEVPWGMSGACLGHEAGDSKGQQRCSADSCALALTSGEGSEQRRPPRHAVYGMQGSSGHPYRKPPDAAEQVMASGDLSESAAWASPRTHNKRG
jgi:hypothetical protein